MDPGFSGGWPFPVADEGARISEEEWKQRQAALAMSPLFAGLSKRHLRALAKVTSVGSYEPGAAVVAEGLGGSMFFVILEGKAEVVQDGRTVSHLTPGRFFGEISVLDQGPRTASVIAETPLRCLRLDGGAFTKVMEKEPLLAMPILRVLASRMREQDRSAI
jgi:CRP/FNR family transcriptional regulator, cyclic AMP receptor protein